MQTAALTSKKIPFSFPLGRRIRKKSFTPSATNSYTFNTLPGLPLEVLQKILPHLSKRDLFSLAETCVGLNNLLTQDYLYRSVELKNKNKMIKFLKTVSKSSSLSNMVLEIIFVHPVADANKDFEIGKTGYSYSAVTQEPPYVDIVLELLLRLKNLKSANLTDISPRFEFSAAALKRINKLHTGANSFQILRLSSEYGWNIPLRPNLVYPFGDIKELHLTNVVIDGESFEIPNKAIKDLITSSPAAAGLSFLRQFRSLDHEHKQTQTQTHSPVNSLTLAGCTVSSNGWKRLQNYFTELTTLKLKSLTHVHDLAIPSCFVGLEILEVDLGSSIFEGCYLQSDLTNALTLVSENTFTKFATKNNLRNGEITILPDQLLTDGSIFTSFESGSYPLSKFVGLIPYFIYITKIPNITNLTLSNVSFISRGLLFDKLTNVQNEQPEIDQWREEIVRISNMHRTPGFFIDNSMQEFTSHLDLKYSTSFYILMKILSKSKKFKSITFTLSEPSNNISYFPYIEDADYELPIKSLEDNDITTNISILSRLTKYYEETSINSNLRQFSTSLPAYIYEWQTLFKELLLEEIDVNVRNSNGRCLFKQTFPNNFP